MSNILKPTPEEAAYHEGWIAFFDERDKGILAKNKYDELEERNLFESWENGKRSAETTALAMTR